MNKYIYVLLSALILLSCHKVSREKEALGLQRQAKEAVMLGGNNATPMAYDFIDKAIRIMPKMAELYATKAEFQVIDENIEEALKNYQTAIELDANNPNFWVGRAAAYKAMGDSIQNIENLKKSIQLYDALISNLENEDREGYLISKYYIKSIIDNDKESNIEKLRQTLATDTSLNSQRINSGILMLETIDLEEHR